MQEHAFQQTLAILFKSWNMKLNDSTGAAIGSGKRLVTARPDVAINARFTFAKNTAGRMSRHRLACVVHPLSITSRDQDFRIDTAEGFCVSVIDNVAPCGHSGYSVFIVDLAGVDFQEIYPEIRRRSLEQHARRESITVIPRFTPKKHDRESLNSTGDLDRCTPYFP
jgi:hypothetical protein